MIDAEGDVIVRDRFVLAFSPGDGGDRDIFLTVSFIFPLPFSFLAATASTAASSAVVVVIGITRCVCVFKSGTTNTHTNRFTSFPQRKETQN